MFEDRNETVALRALVLAMPRSTMERKVAPPVGEVSRPSVMAWMAMSLTPAAVADLQRAMRWS